jgi:HK97 family phage major capsid protein
MELNEIREKANKLGVDMQAILAKAKAEQRELSQDEERDFDKMDADREKLLGQQRRLERGEELAGSRGRQAEVVPPTQRPRQGSSSESRVADREQERRDHTTVLQGFFDRGRRPEYREAAKRLFGADDYQFSDRMFVALPGQALRSKRPDDVRAWERQFERSSQIVVTDLRNFSIRNTDPLTAGVVSPDNTGHYVLQPSEMLRALEEALLAYGGMREVATVLRTDTGVPLPFPTVNDTSNKGVIITETTQETTELPPTFAQMVLHSFTYSSKKVPVSIEFLQDNAINFEARIGEMLGTRIARITNDHFTTGVGTTQPTGIVVAATDSGITTAAATAMDYTSIMGLEHSVDPAYRMRGPNGSKFMFNDSTLLALKKILVPHFSGDTGGWPLWRPGLQVGEPDTIDGYQYVINQSMAGPTGSSKSMIFGALNKYQIRDVRLVEIVRLNELRAEYREVEWFAFYRGDGNLLDAGTHPVKYLTQHS